MMVFSGHASQHLAVNLADFLHVEYRLVEIDCFADQESQVYIPSVVFGQDVIIVQSISTPSNNRLMELLLMVDGAKRAGCGRVIVVAPYLGYSRQDSVIKDVSTQTVSSMGMAVVAKLFRAVSIDALLTVDLHNLQSKRFFQVPIFNIDAQSLFIRHIQKHPELAVVFPDKGSYDRNQAFASCLSVDVIVLSKQRMKANTCEISICLGDIAGKDCVVIDDIVDTAETLCQTIDILHRLEAKSIQAVVTHALLSGDALQKISTRPIDRLFISNTISQISLPEFIRVVDVSPCLFKTLQHLIA